MKKKVSKGVRAFWYIVLGVATMILAISFCVYMFLSGTFIPAYGANGIIIGPWLLRKILYLLMFGVTLGADWFVVEGYSYLERH